MLQGMCRSCWAFASAAAIETLWAKQSGKQVDVSPQAFVDCCAVQGFFGCNGGWARRCECECDACDFGMAWLGCMVMSTLQPRPGPPRR